MEIEAENLAAIRLRAAQFRRDAKYNGRKESQKARKIKLNRIPQQVFSKELMSTITYSTARDHLAEVWDKTVSTREPGIVSRRGAESIVMLPLEEREGLQETAHLLRSPANARRLLASLNRLDRGEGDILSMESLEKHSGIQ